MTPPGTGGWYEYVLHGRWPLAGGRVVMEEKKEEQECNGWNHGWTDQS